MSLLKTITYATGPLKLVWQCSCPYRHHVIQDGENSEDEGHETSQSTS
ncbi:MAG: hypothetical protein KGR26_07450 [Cyanobacteria bacterium REEB65]|nr:hypothetical protein [Cyanobacteria bacterium REEB65]